MRHGHGIEDANAVNVQQGEVGREVRRRYYRRNSQHWCVAKRKMDEGNRSHIYVALNVSDQDEISAATVANIGVYGNGASGVASNMIRQMGGRSWACRDWVAVRCWLCRGREVGYEARLAEGRGKERAS